MLPLQIKIGDVAARYGISIRTIDRWLDDPRVEFPLPVYIRKRRYWAVADLETWERRRAANPVKRAA